MHVILLAFFMGGFMKKEDKFSYPGSVFSNNFSFSFKKMLLLLLTLRQVLNAGATYFNPGCHDVLIIGAGIAGLAAARNLTDTQQDALVLEAQNDIGGRIHYATVQDVQIDLGASWLHKIDTNPLKNLVKNHELDLQTTRYSLLFPLAKFKSMQRYDEHNRPTSPELMENTLNQVGNFGKHLDGHQKDYAGRASYADALKDYCQDKNLSLGGCTMLTSMVEQIVSFDNGVSLTDISAGENLVTSAEDAEEHTNEGQHDHIFYPRSYYQVIDVLARDLSIQRNQAVNTINYSGSMIRVETHPSSGSLGYCYCSNQIIITTSIGVLQSGDLVFQPPLPSEKYAAIHRLNSGRYNKLVLTFEKPFWETDKEWLYFFNPQGSFEVMNYAKFGDKAILVFFTQGKFSGQLEQMSDQAVKEILMERLRGIYGEKVPVSPLHFVRTRWGQEKFFRGSYSSNSPSSTLEDYKEIARPIGCRVFFAGEHTDEEDYGAAHGAYKSGLAAAEKILACRQSLTFFSQPLPVSKSVKTTARQNSNHLNPLGK